jgi:hypothetical protein
MPLSAATARSGSAEKVCDTPLLSAPALVQTWQL